MELNRLGALCYICSSFPAAGGASTIQNLRQVHIPTCYEWVKLGGLHPVFLMEPLSWFVVKKGNSLFGSLSDAHLHIPMHRYVQHFNRQPNVGEAYQFRALP
jgi:hypothetical protein